MHHPRMTALIAIMAIPALAACQVKDDKEAAASGESSATAARTEAPEQSTVVVEQKPAPVAVAVIQTQPGPDGMSGELNKVAVTGDVLTVQITVRAGTDGKSLYMSNNEISVIDDVTAKRYGMLKDDSGKFLASPLSGDKQVGKYISKGGSEIFWFKFPAPPATSKTVSINLPGIAPFDGVPVTR